jgi:hypothetical protein
MKKIKITYTDTYEISMKKITKKFNELYKDYIKDGGLLTEEMIEIVAMGMSEHNQHRDSNRFLYSSNVTTNIDKQLNNEL